ncbi:MAG TPA: hypothetical protein VKX17_19775 [Planctomycetota bacterium]|nr:hypothetical protein [Planctomycetota bacterium]
MSSEDIDAYLKRKPFEPFTIFVSDGTKYAIRTPERVLASRTRIDIGQPIYDGSYIMDKITSIALSHIVRLEPVEKTPSVVA